jgi:hypothetical protein
VPQELRHKVSAIGLESLCHQDKKPSLALPVR